MDPTTIKIADTESETPPRSQPIKPLSFTNGTSLKKHHHPPPAPPFTAEVVAYKECLKNHAATLGSHALDGCGEFMPSPDCTATDPTSLKCAACGCHRNFHRRDYNNESSSLFTPATHFLEFHHHQPPSSRRRGSTSALSPPPPQHQPPPISYAPHMLLALSTAVAAEESALQIATPGTPPTTVKTENQRVRKRFRSKFSKEQKEKMSAFAEKLGWKMPRSDDQTVAEFCTEVGIRRGVLKVWMHNNKNTFGKKDKENCTLLPTAAAAADDVAGTTNNDTSRISFDNKNNNSHLHVSTNGSSSSS